MKLHKYPPSQEEVPYIAQAENDDQARVLGLRNSCSQCKGLACTWEGPTFFILGLGGEDGGVEGIFFFAN